MPTVLQRSFPIPEIHFINDSISVVYVRIYATLGGLRLKKPVLRPKQAQYLSTEPTSSPLNGNDINYDGMLEVRACIRFAMSRDWLTSRSLPLLRSSMESARLKRH